MAPEYAGDGIFSVKSDVFSFGVLVLEIVTGKRNRGFAHKEHSNNLIGHVSIVTVYHYLSSCTLTLTVSLFDFSVLLGLVAP